MFQERVGVFDKIDMKNEIFSPALDSLNLNTLPQKINALTIQQSEENIVRSLSLPIKKSYFYVKFYYLLG